MIFSRSNFSVVEKKNLNYQLPETNKLIWFSLGQYSQPTFFQRAGIRASYMQSSASRRFSLITMVPSMASLRSVKVVLTRAITLCIRSISWRRKMFMGCKEPIFRRRSFT